MKIIAVKCLKCKTMIYPRCVNDMMMCKCNSCKIEKTENCIHISGNMNDYEVEKISILTDKFIDEAKDLLYDDWKTKENKYGVIYLEQLQ